MSAGDHVASVLRSIAANVKAARARRGMTQEALAEAATVDLRFLQKVETGSANLSITILVRLADALHLKPGLLLRSARLPPPRRGRPPSRRPAR